MIRRGTSRRCPARLWGVPCALVAGVLSATGSAAAQPIASAPPACPVVTYHSAPQLRAQRVCMNLGVTTHGTQPGTYLFLTPGGKLGLGAGIYQGNGALVWWLPFDRPDYNLTEVRFGGRPYLAVWAQNRPATQYDSGTITLYNEHYQKAGAVTVQGAFHSNGADVHEFEITPQGDALLGIDTPEPVTFRGRHLTVTQYVVQKIALVRGSRGIHSGRLLFQWQSLKHVPVSQSHWPIPRYHGIWDYFHGNAISQDTDGNLIVSSRHTWGIYKISVTTGHTIWQVGARGDHMLAEPWCYQHDIRALGENRYSMFDDGGRGPGCLPPSTEHPSRGLIVQVDPSQNPAGVRLLRSYVHTPGIDAFYCGSMQPLAGGGALVGWGNVPEVTEFGPSGAIRMDLSMTNWSYRAYRFPWVGLPRTRPAAAAKHIGGGTTVWASWNGSTQVASWRVLAGATPSSLTRVGPASGKTGFETTMVINLPYADVAVQALDAQGHVLATSNTVPVSS